MIYCKFEGGLQENFEFTMGPDTSAHTACSTSLNGELYVFGGHASSIKQVIFNINYPYTLGLQVDTDKNLF